MFFLECYIERLNLNFKTHLCVCNVKERSEHPEIVTVHERKVDILPTAQPAYSTAASGDSSDTELGSSKPFTALKDRFLQVCIVMFTFPIISMLLVVCKDAVCYCSTCLHYFRMAKHCHTFHMSSSIIIVLEMLAFLQGKA